MNKFSFVFVYLIAVLLISPAFFYWTWNVFAVEVLHLPAVTFYQAICAIVLIGTFRPLVPQAGK